MDKVRNPSNSARGNDNVMQYFRKILKNRQKQMTLDRFLPKEKSSGGNVNEPQLSTSGFQMKERKFAFQ
jgi:ribose 1,5-bisphosphokinase PhnN